LFGWKPGSVRDDLQVVLDTSTPDDVGFSAIERTMLRNILGLHERRIADVMIHRADIVAVKRDIPLGELMGLFESAAHSRLVVYNETLDDPVGIVHIRDLLAFMTASARCRYRQAPSGRSPCRRARPLRAVNLAMPLADANIIRKLLFVPPSMRRSICWRRCRPRAFTWRWWWTKWRHRRAGLDRGHRRTDRRRDRRRARQRRAAGVVRQADNSFIADARQPRRRPHRDRR
jgi:hypothetical protein